MDVRQKLPDRRDLLVLALLCLLPVMAFSALLFSGKTLYRGDLTKVWYPLAVFKARLLSSGQLPLWNPYIQFGFPQLAPQDKALLIGLAGCLEIEGIVIGQAQSHLCASNTLKIACPL